MKDNSVITRTIFAKNLKLFRNDLKISQLELSGITGLSHNYINDLEHEKKSPSFGTIVKLATALKIEPYQLLMQEKKLSINGTEFFIEELSDSIAFLVKEKCIRFIVDYEPKEKN